MAKATRHRRTTAAAHRPAPEPGRQPSQERGERRVEEILDAAAEVIAEVGVEGATTNAIAERAGSSVGSLYHFFPNKEAIVLGLASRYEGQMRELNRESMSQRAASLPLRDMVDGIVTPLARFMERTPAYMPVYFATRDSRNPGSMSNELNEVVVGFVEELMASRAPRVAPQLRRLHAGVAVEMVHRLLEYSWTAPASQRHGIVQEIKRLLTLYSRMIEEGSDPLKAS